LGHAKSDVYRHILYGFYFFSLQTLTRGRRLGFPGAINGCFNFMPLEAGKLFCLAGLAEDNTSDCCVSKVEREAEIVKLQARLDLIWEIFGRHCE